MAVYTQLSEVEIKKILDGYDLGSFISYRGIKDGIENTNYLVITNKKN